MMYDMSYKVSFIYSNENKIEHAIYDINAFPEEDEAIEM